VARHPVNRRSAILASRTQAFGLPASAIAVMFGIVLVANLGRFGVGRAVMGAVLIVAGLVFGVRLFRGVSRRVDKNQDHKNQDQESDS